MEYSFPRSVFKAANEFEGAIKRYIKAGNGNSEPLDGIDGLDLCEVRLNPEPSE
jgi:hypothetical protein